MPENKEPVQATVVERVRPDVPERPEFFAVFTYCRVGDSDTPEWDNEDTVRTRDEICEYQCPIDIIPIPGTKKAAHLEKRAGLLEKALEIVAHLKKKKGGHLPYPNELLQVHIEDCLNLLGEAADLDAAWAESRDKGGDAQ